MAEITLIMVTNSNTIHDEWARILISGWAKFYIHAVFRGPEDIPSSGLQHHMPEPTMCH